MIDIKRTDIRLKADPTKVILKFLNFGSAARFQPVIDAVLALDETTAEAQLQGILAEFEHRHFDLRGEFLKNYQWPSQYVTGAVSEGKKLLIGAYFTHEYSIQASALFNPSIVPHPDQSGMPTGALRFVLSLRATGEGHISSIAFMTGVLSENGDTALDVPSQKLTTGQLLPKADFEGAYDLQFPDGSPLDSRVLFPQSANESNGMEDARFVLFEEGGKRRYLSTYTAYNGRAIFPQLIETEDFRQFKIRPFQGAAASDKGMAIFPEKINGKYAMIGRQGGRSLSIMFSDDLLRWEEYRPLQHPQRDWELLQMGNCGSPIRTPKGWLLLTHAVGAMRKYVLSLSLLDLNDPSKVIASLDQPLLTPTTEEREGYVPNVLYTCGMLLHNGRLVIPYAMSDSAISFATAELDEVLFEMMNDK
ncbi:MAG: glycoside hydrolase family 130 protein [Saprospiraceae bacterium]|nr:glycoside hydrolase family 130 protein [Saprospiraceae bacterium]